MAPPSIVQILEYERQRISNLVATAEDEDDIADLCDLGAVLGNRLRAAPCASLEDAVIKLQGVAYGLNQGERFDAFPPGDVIVQVINYLRSGAVGEASCRSL